MSQTVEYTNQYILLTAMRNLHLHLHNKIIGAIPSLLNRFLQLCLIQHRAKSTFLCRNNIFSVYPLSLSASEMNANLQGKGRGQLQAHHIPSYEVCWKYFPAKMTRTRRNYIWSNFTFSNCYVTHNSNLEQQFPNTAFADFIKLCAYGTWGT